MHDDVLGSGGLDGLRLGCGLLDRWFGRSRGIGGTRDRKTDRCADQDGKKAAVSRTRNGRRGRFPGRGAVWSDRRWGRKGRGLSVCHDERLLACKQ
ncbi:hypothetical protein NBRC3293_1385 [Gluconobacter oxydans NBRC 3293]|uniref:Uncharacterized protein n=1 Tax=Gluconobacter oxydans NBRC 3293 TaxID=1315969 RepID=A0A829X5I4_GLUOY|nr:hypothetical protein NBRC3293_1385 [Gluconobacter oxydans NBRC 3293]